jgi:NitT/TauT family transport system substrate-binding protein
MGKFRISSHGRLHEWVARELGYFADEGLDYEFNVAYLEVGRSSVAHAGSDGDLREGAYEHYGTGESGKRDMSCACHWAVNQAAVDQRGRMWGHAYSVSPAGIYVAPDAGIERPEDLTGVDVAVGYHSGSHFSTIQALEVFLQPDDIALRFLGYPYDRVDALLEGRVPAANIWGAATYLVEQQGFRKVVDATFMQAFMFSDDIDSADVERYFNALKRAQMAIDLEPERFKHHFLNEIPERFHDRIDVRLFGTGERVVFLPYSQEMYERSQRWMRERRLFEELAPQPDYAAVVQA